MQRARLRADKKKPRTRGVRGITQGDFGRGDWIRTSDPLLPKQVRYQAALRPEKPCERRFYAAGMMLSTEK